MSERKLTDAQVEEIRQSKQTHEALARKYGVRTRLISDIKRDWHYRVKKDKPEATPRVRKGIDPRDMRKLTPEQVRLVRKELALGTTIKDIAKMLKVNPNTITNIRDRITYRDVR